MRSDLANMKKTEANIRNFIKTNGRLPNYATMHDMDTNKDIDVSKGEYCGMFYGYYNFWLKNGRFPNFVTKNILKAEPTILNLQDNKYTCCPTSLSMISTKLFNPKSELELARIFGTIYNDQNPGTPPKNLLDPSRQAQAGLIIKAMSRNPSNVKAALDKYKGVLCHYETGPADCSGFINNYGHFCIISGVAGGYYYIMDPTRGYYKCRTLEMDHATNGRNIWYYSVELK